MAENQRRRLSGYIKVLRDWSAERDISRAEHAFSSLMQMDREKDQDLWLELRQVLAENNDLCGEEAQWYLSDHELAAKGYCWYDPREWTAPAPSGT